MAGATATAGSQRATTDAQGNFELRGLLKGQTIAIQDCAYSSTSTVEAGSRQVESIRITPLFVDGTVASNLTKKPVNAHLEAGSVTLQTGPTGKVHVEGLCPGDQLTISAKKYGDASVQVDESRTLKLSLRADATTTAVQEVAWEAAQAWALACGLTHPDSLKWISKAQCIKLLKDSAAQGYQSVSSRVKSVTYIKWTFPKCSQVSFGPKTYKHTAAINYTLQQSTPAGGVAALSGIEHLVQTKDGVWRWFPTAGCDFPLT